MYGCLNFCVFYPRQCIVLFLTQNWRRHCFVLDSADELIWKRASLIVRLLVRERPTWQQQVVDKINVDSWWLDGYVRYRPETNKVSMVGWLSLSYPFSPCVLSVSTDNLVGDWNQIKRFTESVAWCYVRFVSAGYYNVPLKENPRKERFTRFLWLTDNLVLILLYQIVKKSLG